MQRIYLNVAPEERDEVRRLGARWDGDSKRWFIECEELGAEFGRWVVDDGQQEAVEEFNIVSDRTFVAAATVACQHCAGEIAALASMISA